MKSPTSIRPSGLMLVAVFVGLLAAGSTTGFITTSAAKTSDYSLGVSPSSQTIQAGQQASYTVTTSAINGWTNPVTLTTSGVPSGATACFPGTPPSSCAATYTTTPTPTTPAPSVTLTIKNAPVRSTPYTITVNGQSGNGSTKHSVALSLTVNAGASYSLSVSPSSVIVDAGSPATYDVTVNPTTFTGAVTLSVAGLPGYAAASFSPNPATASASTLTVTTDMSRTPSGTFPLVITGMASSLPPQSVQASLVVSTAKGTPFGISGDISGLAPGKAAEPISLTLRNLNHKSISVTALGVVITSVSAPNAFGVLTCDAGDFAVTQYSGVLPLTVPGDGTIHLDDPSLGVPSTDWPAVRLQDRATNQDGCKGATVNLSYSGAASGN